METSKLTKAELEALCLKQKIIIEREDPFNKSKIFLPNIEKINKMIREFDFLVDGASRGKSVNTVSKIERYLFDHEEDADARSKYLATHYSNASMYIENHRNLLEDKQSENWKYLFVNYFKLEDIYQYFNKKTGASTFFERFQIYKDMVELNYNVKLMDYLRSQVELEIPLEEDKDQPGRLEDNRVKLAILHELGVVDLIRERIPENTLHNLARFISSVCFDDPSVWRTTLKNLENLNMQNDKDILSDLNLNKAHEIFSVFGIKMEKE